MSAESFKKVLSEEQRLVGDAEEQIISCLNEFYQTCTDSALEEVSERSHLNFDLPDQNPEHCPMPSDTFKELTTELPNPTQDYLPPLPPNFSLLLQSEIVKSSSLPGNSVAGFLDYLVQFSVNRVKLLHEKKEILLLLSRQYCEFEVMKAEYTRYEQEIFWYLDFSSRILSMCEYSSININETTLKQFFDVTTPDLNAQNLRYNEANKDSFYNELHEMNDYKKSEDYEYFYENQYAERVLNVTDPYITIEDVEKIFSEEELQISLSKAFSIGLKHCNYIYRDQMLEIAAKTASERKFTKNTYTSNLQEMIGFITEYVEEEEFYHEQTENDRFLKESLDMNNDLEEIILQMVNEPKSNDDLEYEYYCCKLLEKAMLLHQQFAKELPSYLQAGYHIQPDSSIANVEISQLSGQEPVYSSVIEISEYISRADCEPERQQHDQFEGSGILSNVASEKERVNDVTSTINPKPSTFHWKDAAKQCDFSINFVFGLLTACNPQNRESAAEKFIAHQIEENVQFVREAGGQVAGRDEVVKAFQLVRFDQMSSIYSEMVETQSQSLLFLSKMLAVDGAQFASLQELVKLGQRKPQNDIDFTTLVQNTQDFTGSFQFEQTLCQTQSCARDEAYTIRDGSCVNARGEQVVFEQAIDDANYVLLQDEVAVQHYYERLQALGRRKYLEFLVFEDDYIQIKHETIQEREDYIVNLSDSELYALINGESEEKYTRFNVNKYIDISQVIFNILQEEHKLLKYKSQIVAHLYEISVFSSEHQRQVIKKLAELILIERPLNFQTIANFKSAEEEEDISLVEFSNSMQMVSFLVDNLQLIPSPNTEISVLNEAYSYIAEIISSAIELQHKQYKIESKCFEINGRGYDYNLRADYQNIVEIIFSIFSTCSEMQNLFVSESYIKINQGVQHYKSNEERWYEYPLFSTRLHEAIELSVARSYLVMFSSMVEEYNEERNVCFALPENLQHLVDPGLFEFNEIIINLLHEHISDIKIGDQEAPEQMFCSICGLLAPQGGSSKKCTTSEYTNLFLLEVSLRDIYMKADKSSRTQIFELLEQCNFEIFEGAPPVFPLPFSLLIKLINFKEMLFRSEQVLLESHYLRISDIKEVMISTDCEINYSELTIYPRCIFGKEIYKYKEILSYQCLMNNLPYFCTCDERTYDVLFEQFDLNDPEFVMRLLEAEDFKLNENDTFDISQEESIRDVLISANMDAVCQSPLFSSMSTGIIGIFERTIYCEAVYNYFRTANLRENEISVDFCLTNELINGNLIMEEGNVDQVVDYEVKYYDNINFFKRIDVNTTNVCEFPNYLSSLYCEVSEDILFNVTEQVANDYSYRMKTYHEDELNQTIEITYEEEAVYTFGQSILAETIRIADIAEVKGTIALIRSELNNVNKDEFCLLVDALPIYRGKKESRSILNETFLISDDGVLQNIYKIPHPVTVELNASHTILQAMLLILQTYESAIRYSITRTVVSGKQVFESGNLITSQLEFVDEIAKISLQVEDDEADVELLKDFLKDRQNYELSRYHVNFDKCGCLSCEEEDQIIKNSSKVEENIKLQRQVNIVVHDEQHEIYANLELSKLLLILKRCIYLRDKNESMNVLSLIESYNMCIRKGLFENARYMYTNLEHINAMTNYNYMAFNQSFTMSGDKNYQAILCNSFCRVFKDQLQEDPTKIYKYDQFENQCEERQNILEESKGQEESETPFCPLLEESQAREDELLSFSPVAGDYYMRPHVFENEADEYQVCLQAIETAGENAQSGMLISMQDILNYIVRQQVGVSEAGITNRFMQTGIKSFVSLDESEQYYQQQYSVIQSSILSSLSYTTIASSPLNNSFTHELLYGAGISGCQSFYCPFGLNSLYEFQYCNNDLQPFYWNISSSFNASICVSLTEIELAALQIAQSEISWKTVEESSKLAQQLILFDILERVCLRAHLENTDSKDSILLSQEAVLGGFTKDIYAQEFKMKIDEIAPDSIEQSIYAPEKTQQLKQNKLVEEESFLLYSLPLFMQEKTIETVVPHAFAEQFKQNWYLIEEVFVEILYLKLRESEYNNFARYLEARSSYIIKALVFAEEQETDYISSSDLESSFLKYVRPYCKTFTDLFVTSCKEREIQTKNVDFCQQILSKIGFLSENYALLDEILQEKEQCNFDEVVKDYEEAIKIHQFTPEFVIKYSLSQLHAGFIYFSAEFICQKIFSLCAEIFNAPENKIKDSKLKSYMDTSFQYKRGPNSDYYSFKLFKVPYNEIIEELNEFGFEGYILQFLNYNVEEELRFSTVLDDIEENKQHSINQAAYEKERLLEQIEYRSVSILNPLAIELQNMIQELEVDLLENFELYINQEEELRQQLHTEEINQVIKLQNEYICQKYAFKKLKLFVSFIENEALSEHNEISRQTASKLYEIAGIQIDSAPETLELQQFNGNENNEQIMESYENSISTAQNSLKEIEIEQLLFENLSNYRQEMLDKELRQISETAQKDIIQAFLGLYENIINSELQQMSLTNEISRVSALISQKQTEIDEIEQEILQLESNVQKPRANKSKNQVQEIVTTALEEQLAQKMLPELENAALKRGNTVQKQGEQLVLLYERQCAENAKLSEELLQLRDALRVVREKSAIDQEIFQKNIKQLEKIVNDQETEAVALQNDIEELNILKKEVLNSEKERQIKQGSALEVKMMAELDALRKEKQLYEKKNEQLRDEYADLFKLLE